MKLAARLCALPLLALPMSGCGMSEHDAAARAAAYRVAEDAPIAADESIVISAPARTVWAHLTDINRWSSWRPEVSQSRLAGPLAAATSFTWTVDDTVITSRIAAIDRHRRIAWTGHAMGLTAIHIWTIEPLGPTRTLVRTSETMTGFPSSIFYSSADLQSTNAKWLADLKRISEQAGRENHRDR